MVSTVTSSPRSPSPGVFVDGLTGLCPELPVASWGQGVHRPKTRKQAGEGGHIRPQADAPRRTFPGDALMTTALDASAGSSWVLDLSPGAPVLYVHSPDAPREGSSAFRSCSQNP